MSTLALPSMPNAPDVALACIRRRNRPTYEQLKSAFEKVGTDFRVAGSPKTVEQYLLALQAENPRLSRGLHIIEAPVVADLSSGAIELLNTLRDNTFAHVIRAFVIDSKYANTRKLRAERGGTRARYSSDCELDPDYLDPDGPQRLVELMASHDPDVHIIQTSDGALSNNVRAFCESTL